MKNWYETFSFSPKRLLAIGASDVPGGEAAAKLKGLTPIARAAVASEVTKAESSGSTVRGIGSRWSSGDVMATGRAARPVRSRRYWRDRVEPAHVR